MYLVMVRKYSVKRQRILQLFEDHHILTANEIVRLLPDIDRATIYRNLKYFVETGEIRQLQIQKNVMSYERFNPDDMHQHFLCRNCNKVLKIYGIDKNYIQSKLPHDVNVEFIDLNVIGVCDECSSVLKPC
ncbi:MAG: transcriptional repressor [Candidatus Dojkabacteria bacterium]|nr:MAG: transcriptional repressor [Candidatus Dojkabacteria bacterium]